MTPLSWHVGAVKITAIQELEVTGASKFLLPDATPEAISRIDWLRPHFANDEGELTITVQAFVVETPTKRIVVDTCIGNDKPRGIPGWNMMQTAFLRDLEAAGYPPSSIDVVLCTHLHVDHVGWNTMLVDGEWVPTFPNARYLVARTEFEHAMADEDATNQQVMADSLTPVVDAGLVDLVDTTHQVSPEVCLEPTHGHTPGHVSIAITSEGARAFISGDLAHHPCQMHHPEWCSTFDVSPSDAVATRARVFEACASDEILYIGTHFAAPTAGQVVRDGAVYRFKV